MKEYYSKVKRLRFFLRQTIFLDFLGILPYPVFLVTGKLLMPASIWSSIAAAAIVFTVVAIIICPLDSITIWKYRSLAKHTPTSPIYCFRVDTIVDIFKYLRNGEMVILHNEKKKIIGSCTDYERGTYKNGRYCIGSYRHGNMSLEWFRKQLTEMYPEGIVPVLLIGDQDPRATNYYKECTGSYEYYSG